MCLHNENEEIGNLDYEYFYGSLSITSVTTISQAKEGGLCNISFLEIFKRTIRDDLHFSALRALEKWI